MTMNLFMDISGIREKLHNYLEVADDKKVKALYAIMETEIEDASFELSTELEKELDDRYESYKSGKAKLISAVESKKRIEKRIQSARRK